MFSRLICHGLTRNSCQTSLFSRLFHRTILTSKPSSTLISPFNRAVRFSLVPKTQCSSQRICKRGEVTLADNSQTRFTFDTNTNVANNVFLYKFERMRYFRSMNGFAVFQLLFWLGICYFTLVQLPDRDSKTTDLWKYLKDNYLTLGVAVIAVLAGIGSALLIWTFTAKSVKYIILNKGGKTVTFVTYHPINEHVAFTVPLEEIRCRSSRKQIKNFLPLKLKGRSFYYMVDAEGDFVNATLFDFTVGATRS